MHDCLEDKLHPNHISISFQTLMFEFSLCTLPSLSFLGLSIFSFLVPSFHVSPSGYYI